MTGNKDHAFDAYTTDILNHLESNPTTATFMGPQGMQGVDGRDGTVIGMELLEKLDGRVTKLEHTINELHTMFKDYYNKKEANNEIHNS